MSRFEYCPVCEQPMRRGWCAQHPPKAAGAKKRPAVKAPKKKAAKKKK